MSNEKQSVHLVVVFFFLSTNRCSFTRSIILFSSLNIHPPLAAKYIKKKHNYL